MSQSNIEKIKSALDAVNAARDKATQGEYWTHMQSYNYQTYEVFKGTSHEDEELDTLEVICSETSEADAEFIALAANEIKNLTAALLTACEALEALQWTHFPMKPISGEDYTQWALEHNCAKAKETLNAITAQLCNNAADGEGE